MRVIELESRLGLGLELGFVLQGVGKVRVTMRVRVVETGAILVDSKRLVQNDEDFDWFKTMRILIGSNPIIHAPTRALIPPTMCTAAHPLH